jgi:predicted Zn-dependent protease
MNAMGVQAFTDLKSSQQVDQDPRTNAYVECVAKAVTDISDPATKRSWEVVVFKDDTANAFALPGAKIGVHTGLLKTAQTPGQLAAVIGHEVGHVLARHGNERVSDSFATQGGLALISAALKDRNPNYNLIMAGLGIGAQFGVLLPFSRTQESEADLIGLDLMAKAGFDPRESITLWQNMEKSGGANPPEFLSTHPSHGRRMGDLQSHMGDALKLFEASTMRPNCKM